VACSGSRSAPPPERFNSSQADSGLHCGRLSCTGCCYWRVRPGGEKGGSSSLPPSWREVEWNSRESLSSFYPILRIFRVPQKGTFSNSVFSPVALLLSCHKDELYHQSRSRSTSLNAGSFSAALYAQAISPCPTSGIPIPQSRYHA
jgi:hypothetical protein